MTCRLIHLVLLTLPALAWPHHQAAESHPCQLSRVEGGASPERPSLLPAGPPLDAVLCAGRGGQLRIDLRQPGVKAWLASTTCPAGGPPPDWASRQGVAPTTPARVRLHVLLCTWLT